MTSTPVRRHHRLWFRFLLVTGSIAVIGASVGYVLADRVAHESFDPGLLAGMDPAEEHRRFEAAIDRSLVIALVFTALVAGFVALLVRWRVTRPMDEIRGQLGRLADGHYDKRAEVPAEPELAQVARDVNHLAEVLGSSEERRRGLVADLSHELRGPLATLGGYIEAMQDGIVECSPELLAELGQECRRLDRLTADLALVSRVDEGSLALDRRPVALDEAARRVVGRLAPQFDASAVAVAVSAPQPVTVLADADRLDQILVNVVGNALKYTPPGGRVEVSVHPTGGTGRVVVADTGRGIAADELPHVFDRFYRGGAANRTAGTGIGLTIARGLARALGGDLRASSPGAGAGATFTLELPAVAGFTTVSPAHRSSLHPAGVH